MADISQSYGTVAQAAPTWYNDYMTNLAAKGTAGGNTAQYVGASPLQTEAFGNVAANVGNYQPGLTAAGQNYAAAGNTDISGAVNPYLTAGSTTSGLSQANPYLTAGASGADQLVQNYMNPYTQSVVDQIGRANQQNIQQNLSPGITSGAVGAGQFGSQRGANALALGISNANLGALTQQTQALQTGYSEAMKNAQQQRINQLNAGQTAGTLQNQFNTNQVTAGQVAGNAATQNAQNQIAAGTGNLNLGTQEQQSGLADVNALSTLGAQQQQIAQNKELFPLDVAAKQASIMSGAQIPMSQTSSMTASPLSTIAGLAGVTGGILAQPVTGYDSSGKPIYATNQSLWDKIYGGVKSLTSPSTTTTPENTVAANNDNNLITNDAVNNANSYGDWVEDENGNWTWVENIVP